MSKINFTYTNLTPFKWYVLENFPFIEADFDALTNWQLFCKLGKEMNKIINSVNLSGQQVEDLTNAFNNLQDYVNQYFSDLNVQEEVNNKLDEMAQDGTLAQIINENIFNELNEKLNTNITNTTNNTNKLNDTNYIFNSVEEMKNSELLENNFIVKTLGYYEKNDGGGAYYLITNEIQTPNEMDIISLQNNLYAIYVNDNIINPCQFGCKADGLTNDTTIFQYAVNYAQTNKLEFYTPAGKTFLLDSITFILIPKISLYGVIKATADSNVYTFDYDANNFNNELYINEIMKAKIKILGLNASSVRINRAYQLLLTTDNNEERRHNFIAYNQFHLGFVNQLEIYPANAGVYWINENIFYGGRIAVLNMHCDSDYVPSDNVFYKCMSEDTNFVIEKGNGNRFYDIRMENFQKLDLGDNTIGNIFTKDFINTQGTGFISPNSRYAHLAIFGGQDTFQNNGGMNTVKINEAIETILFNINYYNNPANVPTNESTLNLQYQNQLLYQTELIPLPDIPVGINFEAGNMGTAYGIKCYNSNKELITDVSQITTAPIQNSPLFGWTSISGNTGYIANSFGSGSRYNYWAITNPKSNVAFIQLFAIGVGTNVKATTNILGKMTYYQDPDKLGIILSAAQKYKAN